MNLITPKTALISLSDKSNLDELITFLLGQKVKIISTGGTYNAIKKITNEVIEVSEFTGFEEMMDGRVKTLHPKIHAGILARRETALEKIDIGGPTMIRSAAKNFKDVAVISNPSDYGRLINEWKDQGGISYEFRKELSQKVDELEKKLNNK